MENPTTHIAQHHHITLCVGGAQEDYDFHTKILGLKSVKKTLLYDGKVPIYHLYYGNDQGEESTLVTSFPMRQSGRMARRGSGQISVLSLSVPHGSLDWWNKRLHDHGFETKTGERFGDGCIRFEHPCGITYELVSVADDRRAPHTQGPVPSEVGIRGTQGITVSVRDFELSDEFMQHGWGGHKTAEDGDKVRFELGTGGAGRVIDFEVEPGLAPGSWTLGEGFVHHCAFQVANFKEQDAVKGYLEGLGYTDVSDRKDRGYFDSIYVRTPGGALFEATVSKSEGFGIDEPTDSLGSEIMLSPQFEAQREQLLSQLETLEY